MPLEEFCNFGLRLYLLDQAAWKTPVLEALRIGALHSNRLYALHHLSILQLSLGSSCRKGVRSLMSLPVCRDVHLLLLSVGICSSVSSSSSSDCRHILLDEVLEGAEVLLHVPALLILDRARFARIGHLLRHFAPLTLYNVGIVSWFTVAFPRPSRIDLHSFGDCWSFFSTRCWLLWHLHGNLVLGQP